LSEDAVRGRLWCPKSPYRCIPLVHRVERNPLTVIRSGDYVVVDADSGVVEVMSRRLGERSRIF